MTAETTTTPQMRAHGRHAVESAEASGNAAVGPATMALGRVPSCLSSTISMLRMLGSRRCAPRGRESPRHGT